MEQARRFQKMQRLQQNVRNEVLDGRSLRNLFQKHQKIARRGKEMEDKFETRLIRQSGIVPIQKLADKQVEIVGVGAVGHAVAKSLASMGVQNLTLVDGDGVEEHNLGPQMFYEKYLGTKKVHAAKHLIGEINSSTVVDARPNMFRASDKHGDIIFCCVDTMSARKLIWETVKDKVEFFVDGRMLGLAIRVLCVFDEESAKHYENPTNLFTDDEADEGNCTERSTVFTADGITCLMINNLVRWMRDKWTDKNLPMKRFQDINLNLNVGKLYMFK